MRKTCYLLIFIIGFTTGLRRNRIKNLNMGDGKPPKGRSKDE